MDLTPIWVLAFIVNAFLANSLIQMYFLSPVISINRAYEGNRSSEIRRVVLIVADGLRADIFFASPGNHSRLTSIIQSHNSASGISESRGPTYSRIGFTSMLAGIYSDPSAITTLWSRTPYLFDSVLNRSSFNVILGCTSDPLKFLAEEAGDRPMVTEIYQRPRNENYSISGPDIWVGKKFLSLLESNMVPRQDKLLIILHLMETDSAAHTKTVFSKEFRASMEHIDGIVAQVESGLNKYFEDNQTVFIFTADHGMTKRGHGGNSKTEIETPIVIWGDGIKSNRDLMRIQQVDIAALISGTLNIPFPVNSLGQFPSAIWKNAAFAYDALSANFKQLRELMKVKKVPYLLCPQEVEIVQMQMSSAAAISSDYDNAIGALSKSVELTLRGIRYYENYDHWILALLTSYTFLIWILLLSYVVLNFEKGVEIRIFPVYLLILDILVSLFVIRDLLEWSMWRVPFMLIPLYLTQVLSSALQTNPNPVLGASFDLYSFIGILLSSIVGIQIFIFALQDRRETLTLGILLNGIWSLHGKSMSTWKRILLLGSLGALGIFPSLPVVGMIRNPIFVTLGPLTCGFLSIWSLRQYSTKSEFEGVRKRDKGLVCLQTILVFCSSILVHFPDFVLTRLVAWTSPLLCFTIPISISPLFVSLRLLSVFLGISTIMCFLSFTYDSLFPPILYLALFITIKIEIMDENHVSPNFWALRIPRGDFGTTEMKLLDAFRRTWILLIFSLVSFVGTGNVFTIAETKYKKISRCFLTEAPKWQERFFSSARVLLPIMLVMCFFRILVASRREAQRFFLNILLLCQGIAFHTFFSIKTDVESVDIGIALANYIIPQVMTLGLALIYVTFSGLTGLTYSH